jgi:hypothetical protein
VTPELRAAVEKVARANAPTLYGGEEYRLTNIDKRRALRAIRAVAEATREATAAMEGAGASDIYRHQEFMAWQDAAICWAGMHAASILGEALNHD